jgi:hypothetical protein
MDFESQKKDKVKLEEILNFLKRAKFSEHAENSSRLYFIMKRNFILGFLQGSGLILVIILSSIFAWFLIHFGIVKEEIIVPKLDIFIDYIQRIIKKNS